MAFYNRVRLPFYITQPQFTVDEEVYVKANGTRRILRSIVSKEWQAKTDYIPAEWHERFAIALRHDSVQVEGHNVQAGIRINGSYEIEWQEFLDYPVAPAKFKALQEAFVARNTRCGICPVVENQLNIRNDIFEAALDEGEEYTINVAENDSICCYNPVFSIASINSTYVESAEIDQNGIVTLVLKEPVESTGDIELFTYKVTCDDGAEGTASVHGGIKGSLTEPCEMPTNLQTDIPDPFTGSMNITWDEPVPAPASGYQWYLTKDDGVTETTVQTGNTDDLFVAFAGLDFNQLYHFYVRSICSTEVDPAEITSPYAHIQFITEEGEPEPTYNYECEIYLCTNCSEPAGTLIASSTNPSLTLFKYYQALSSEAIVLRPIATSVGVAADQIFEPQFNSCFLACSAPHEHHDDEP